MAATSNIKSSKLVAYACTKVDVALGEKITIELKDVTNPVDWYSMADQVLKIEAEGNNAQVEATAVGATKIRIYNQAEQKILEIAIEVLEAITDPAVDLGVKVGTPELKEKKK